MSDGDGAVNDALERGLAVRREVLGAEYVDRSLAAPHELDAAFQRYVTEHCWGLAWTDDRLSRRERSIATLAITAVLGRMEEFRLHLRGAVRNGLTADELAALVVQIGVYAGVPAAVSSQRALRETLLSEEAADGSVAVGAGSSGEA